MPDNVAELDLRRYLAVVKRRWPTMVASVGVLVAGSLALSLRQTPVYEGEARVLLQPQAGESLLGVQQRDVDPELAVATEIQVLKSGPVLARVLRQLGPVAKASASRVGETLLINVHGRSTSPRRAAQVATTYAQAYIDLRREQAVQDLLAVGQQVQGTVTELERELDRLDAEVGAAAAAQRGVAIESARSRRDALVTQHAFFRQRLGEIQVQAALKTGTARLVSPASVPDEPVKPKPVQTAILATTAGLLLGLVLVALREHMDESIKTRGDLAPVTELPVVGTIPSMRAWKGRPGGPELASRSSADHAVGEAFRSLRTAVLLLGVEQPLRVIQVTSAKPGEGKTTVATNLAAVMAQVGNRVVVVDFDLRRPTAYRPLGLAKAPGYASILSGDVTLVESLQYTRVGDQELAFLASGQEPPNPSELLSSKRTTELLYELQTMFDTVLVDSSPVLPATDATVLAGWVDATILVALAGATTRKDLRASIEVLKQVDAPLAGVVLNQASQQDAYGYRYGYTYRQGAPKAPAPTV